MPPNLELADAGLIVGALPKDEIAERLDVVVDPHYGTNVLLAKLGPDESPFWFAGQRERYLHGWADGARDGRDPVLER